MSLKKNLEGFLLIVMIGIILWYLWYRKREDDITYLDKAFTAYEKYLNLGKP